MRDGNHIAHLGIVMLNFAVRNFKSDGVGIFQHGIINGIGIIIIGESVGKPGKRIRFRFFLSILFSFRECTI